MIDPITFDFDTLLNAPSVQPAPLAKAKTQLWLSLSIIIIGSIAFSLVTNYLRTENTKYGKE
ncbi:MAG: hypothetical protein WCG95_08130 [bacterium]